MREAAPPFLFHLACLDLFITWGPLLGAFVGGTICSRAFLLQPSQRKRSSRTLGHRPLRKRNNSSAAACRKLSHCESMQGYIITCSLIAEITRYSSFASNVHPDKDDPQPQIRFIIMDEDEKNSMHRFPFSGSTSID